MLTQQMIEKFSMNENEITFFNELLKQSSHLSGAFNIERTGCNDFKVFYEDIFLGRINLWQTPDVFAVVKKSAKRATKLFDNKQDAESFAAQKGFSYVVTTRKGISACNMMYLSGLHNVIHLKNPSLEKCIKAIPKWLKYINYAEKQMLKDINKLYNF